MIVRSTTTKTVLAAAAIAVVTVGGVSAASTRRTGNGMFKNAMDSTLKVPPTEIETQSKLGQELLAKSKPFVGEGGSDEEGRDLANNNYYLQWMVKYSMVFDKCYELPVMSEDGAQEQQDDGSYVSPMTYQSVVVYRMCESGSCSSGCTGGLYMVNAADFVDMWLTAEMEIQEQNCNLVKDTCENACKYGYINYNEEEAANYGDEDEFCLNVCYTQKGWDQCIEQDADDANAELDPLDYLECAEVENNNAKYYDGNGNIKEFWMGLACANGGSEIRLQMYDNEMCSNKVSNDVYAKLGYYGNQQLSKYFSQSVISSGCLSCKEQQDDNGNQNYYDNQDADEIAEVCERLYEESGHCESNLSGVVNRVKEDSCDYIRNVLPAVSSALNGSNSSKRSNKRSSSSNGGGNKAAVAFAWIFAISTACLAYYVYFLIKKIKNSTKLSSLDHQGGTAA